MPGKNSRETSGNRRIGKGAVLTLATAVVLALTFTSALARKGGVPGPPDKDGDGGKGTAWVEISGPMETLVPHSFGLDKDSKRTLELNSWTGEVRGDPVSISYDFETTVGDLGSTATNCKCMQGNKWNEAALPCEPGALDLRGHLVDPVASDPLRWAAVIRVDISALPPGGDGTTNSKGGHSINISTNPDFTGTPTVTGEVETLWIPEGPNQSGSVTVVEDANTKGVFTFYPEVIQVRADSGEIMRCENKDDPIVVTVVTTP